MAYDPIPHHQETKPTKNVILKRTIHKGTEGKHPIPNQGGQGKCPPRRPGPMG